jgi:predicted GNAT family acetyltransferase
MSNIEKEETAGQGHYTVDIDGHRAKLVYGRSGKTMVIEHVAVPDELEGRGVGTRLVGHVVEEAKRDGLQLVPLCSFAKAKIEARPEWQEMTKAPGAR